MFELFLLGPDHDGHDECKTGREAGRLRHAMVAPLPVTSRLSILRIP